MTLKSITFAEARGILAGAAFAYPQLYVCNSKLKSSRLIKVAGGDGTGQLYLILYLRKHGKLPANVQRAHLSKAFLYPRSAEQILEMMKGTQLFAERIEE